MNMCSAVFALLLFSYSFIVAQPQKLETAERRAVVDGVSELLTDNYVFPDVAEQCAEFIQGQLRSGAYDGIVDPEMFASRLTADLQSINKDKHMRVRVRLPEQARMEQEDPYLASLEAALRDRERNYGFERVERFEGNVGFLDFRYFAGDRQARSVAAASMAFLANSDAIIVDMRKNGGGNPEMVQFVCSYFFAEKTHLNSLYWRRGDRTEEFWTLDEVPGMKMPAVPLFVLTSGRTFSGAEEFTYNFKTRKRATIVGETTGGGANPGGTFFINDRFSIFVPTGRAINPVTGVNWEGTGVEPDVTVEADSALRVALGMARKAAETYRAENKTQQVAMLEAMHRELAAAEKRLMANQSDEAEAAVFRALHTVIDNGLLGEGEINRMGYQFLMEEKKAAMAILVFRLNTQAYPQSANTYDSLGEAYMEQGNKELAIRNYKRSLELNPQNSNAVEMLKKMGAGI